MTIKMLLQQALHPFYNVCYTNGQFTSTNPRSFYRNLLPPEGLTFDVSNQKVLANIDVFGTISRLTFYQDNFLTEEKPGVWVNKQYTQTQQLKFRLIVDGKAYDLSASDHDVTIDLVEDSLPRIIHRYHHFTVYCIPFCPIVDDHRYSMLVYQTYVENNCRRPLQVSLPQISLFQQKYSDQQNVLIDQKGAQQQVATHGLAAFSIGLIDPNAYQEAKAFQTADLERWLIVTLHYYQALYGDLQMDDPAVGHLFNRALYQSFASFSMNNHEQIVGSNWGSYPATNRIWNKDMYYASLPFLFFDAALCQKTILWFDRYGVKFPGTKFPGGINHSLSNSLSSLLLCALYYEYTNDVQFFREHPQILANGRKIVDTILTQRTADEPMLFTSVWISDAFALGKYHTGSNLCMWKACEGLSQLYQGLTETKLAAKYRTIAAKIKDAILENMTIEGPFGEQFLEGIGDKEKGCYEVKHYQKPIVEQGLIFLSDVIQNGKIQLLMHDGEESDTTLIPFYGFLEKDHPLYTQTLRFAASSANPTYSEEIQGITWGLESGATFPGFTTVLMSALNDSAMFEQRIQELVQLADLDGSWWWWPYKLGARHGEVVRNFGCGKCGWASGIFVSLFVTQYLGLRLQHSVLTVTPADDVTYTWNDLHLGSAFVDVSCMHHQITVTNRKSEPQVVRLKINNPADTGLSLIQDRGAWYAEVILASNQSYTIERKSK
ncbi:glycoside hydrolase [Sporolactobacillus terrae]|uniref:Glycoside hydrolase n=1 Tax=Sporolactobacillus terrae TaxID=269673 RepID=A0A5K7WUP6_9BACL|nr:glycoside hydrolase [Sporolactobacillus terrae]BBN98047.1 glycoside hydrolase [Sporolactobacillus terrae]